MEKIIKELTSHPFFSSYYQANGDWISFMDKKSRFYIDEGIVIVENETTFRWIFKTYQEESLFPVNPIEALSETPAWFQDIIKQLETLIKKSAA